MKPDTCKECPLYKPGQGFVGLTGPLNPVLLIQGETPGKDDIDGDPPTLFSDKVGHWLKANILASAGVDTSRVTFDSTLRCLPPKSKKGDFYPQGDVQQKAELFCRQYDTWDAYSKAIPKLNMGGHTGGVILGNEKIHTYHGHIAPIDGRMQGFTLHPSFVMRKPNALPIVVRHVANLLEANRRPELLKRPTVFKASLPYQKAECAFDLEWHMDTGQVFVVGGAYESGLAYTSHDVESSLEVVKAHLREGNTLIGHNIIDADLRKIDQQPKSWRPEHVFDTKIVAHLVHAHFAGLGFLDLGSLVRFYFPTSEWKLDKSDILLYNGYDTAYNFKLAQALKDDLTLTEQWHLVERQQQLAYMATQMHKRGLIVDTIKLRELVEEQTLHKQELASTFPFNPNAPGQIKDWLKEQGFKVQDAQYETLVKLGGKNPDVDRLIQYRADSKSISTWFEYEVSKKGEFEWANPEAHPSFSVTGTDVARFSSSEPNFQNLPRGEWLRQLIIAPEGYEIVSFDASQLENRTVAWLAHDEQMLSDFASGMDIHRLIASRIFNKRYEDVTDEERTNGKITVHASNYGEGPYNLAERLFHNKKKDSVMKATKLQAAYFAPYSRTKAWQAEVARQLDTGNITLRNPYGRLRFVYAQNSHERMKRGTHFLGCSTGADTVNLRGLMIQRELGLTPVMLVHDELAYYLPIGASNIWKQIKEILYTPVPEMGGFIFPWEMKHGLNYGPISPTNPNGLRKEKII